MDNWQKDRISAAINGTNPMVMAELEGGYAAFGDTQFYLVIVYCYQKGMLHL